LTEARTGMPMLRRPPGASLLACPSDVRAPATVMGVYLSIITGLAVESFMRTGTSTSHSPSR